MTTAAFGAAAYPAVARPFIFYAAGSYTAVWVGTQAVGPQPVRVPVGAVVTALALALLTATVVSALQRVQEDRPALASRVASGLLVFAIASVMWWTWTYSLGTSCACSGPWRLESSPSPLLLTPLHYLPLQVLESSFAPLLGALLDVLAVAAAALVVLHLHKPASRSTETILTSDVATPRQDRLLAAFAALSVLGLLSIALTAVAWAMPTSATSLRAQSLVHLPLIVALVTVICKRVIAGGLIGKAWPTTLGLLVGGALVQSQAVATYATASHAASLTLVASGVLLAAGPALHKLMTSLMVRLSRHGARTFGVAVIANLLDAALTWGWLDAGIADEANPVIDVVGLPVKAVGVTLACLAIWRLAPRLLAPVAVLLSVVLIWHAVGALLMATTT